MNHNILKTVIYDQHEVIRNTQIIPREYSFEQNANYVVVGLRRAGKSTLLYKRVQELVESGISWEQIIYINFEDERLAEFKTEDFNDIISVQAELSDNRGFFFFDEIQIINGWEKFARRMADSGERVFITGSNAKMLSREIETVLGGRYLTKYVHPYNFREYLTAAGIPHDGKALLGTRSCGAIRRQFGEYIKYGGFPESLMFSSKREYIQSIYQKVLLGDIVARNGVRNDYALKILMKKIAETVKNEVSFTKLHSAVSSVGASVSKDSVIDYVEYAEYAYLLFDIKNYYAKFSEREGNPKFYFCDNGLINLFLTDNDTAPLENLVAIYLYQNYGNEIFYLKSQKTKVDIDFWIPEARTAIQVAYSIAGAAREREIANLDNLAMHSDEAEHFIIVTFEEEETITTEHCSIEVVPAYKFLLK